MDFSIEGTLNLLSDKLFLWWEALVKNLPNLIVAITLFIGFLFLARITSRGFKKISHHWLGLDNRAVENLLQGLVFYGIVLLGLFSALGVLKLDKTVASLLAGAGVIGLAIGFAFQEIAANFFSGVLIALTKPYQVGDIVELESHMGRITQISLRTTSITSFQGLEILVPNKDMFTKALTNLTSTPERRLDLRVGVSYSSDLEEVEKLVRSTLADLPGRLKDRAVEVFFYEFGESSINFEARVWITYSRGHSYFLEARHSAILKIKKAFDQRHITIPFPMRTLEISSEGGGLRRLKNEAKNSEAHAS